MRSWSRLEAGIIMGSRLSGIGGEASECGMVGGCGMYGVVRWCQLSFCTEGLYSKYRLHTASDVMNLLPNGCQLSLLND